MRRWRLWVPGSKANETRPDYKERQGQAVGERTAGRLFAAPLKHKTARSVSRALVRLLRPYRDAVKTITYDNGREFEWRRRVARALDCRSCFARPYHSWEKGTVENANGLVRQYFPKHMPLDTVTKRALDAVADEINHRPRKRLGLDTPDQAFAAEIERTGQADMRYKPQGGVALRIAMQGSPSVASARPNGRLDVARRRRGNVSFPWVRLKYLMCYDRFNFPKRDPQMTQANGPMTPDLFGGRETVRTALRRIAAHEDDPVLRGRLFEALCLRLMEREADLGVAQAWTWRGWPNREELTGLDGKDIGIDLVALTVEESWVAIQCKHRMAGEDGRIPILAKGDVDSFLACSQREPFDERWIMANCGLTGNLQKQLAGLSAPAAASVHVREYESVLIGEVAVHETREPYQLQREAIDNVLRGLSHSDADAGQLVMACGTGKTFASLRIAERSVPDGGAALYLTPTIALAAQARREWVRENARGHPLSTIVVCSDRTAGGDDMDGLTAAGITRVTTNPARIAQAMGRAAEAGRTMVVFCTYQSLRQVAKAQAAHGAPDFDLAVADEAHRTTGRTFNAKGKAGFRLVHDRTAVRCRKRLYMTATPRTYRPSDRKWAEGKGFTVVDMDDRSVYGNRLHTVSFPEAVNAGLLVDYEVIVLGVGQDTLTANMRNRLERLAEKDGAATLDDQTRLIGTSLAINGAVAGENPPGRLRRSLIFANTIARSEWCAKALADPEVRRTTARRIGERSMDIEAHHLDASSPADERLDRLDWLKEAVSSGDCRALSNARLFTEGVDVPSLDAVAFLDPRSSQVDIVQAIGRVMRRSPGKRRGYIIVPVIMEPGADLAKTLRKGSNGYDVVGKVLRALQSHDMRLIGNLSRFVRPVEVKGRSGEGEGGEPGGTQQGELTDEDDEEGQWLIRGAGEGIYAHLANCAALKQPGAIAAYDIESAVKRAADLLKTADAGPALARALDISSDRYDHKEARIIGALLIANACLLHRRLRDVPEMRMLVKLESIPSMGSHARQSLMDAWRLVMEKDYKPVFRPASAALASLPDCKPSSDAVIRLAECAVTAADTLTELGYDYAGPLYHRILGSAKSDGAFYTKPATGLMLARLALRPDFMDWKDSDAVRGLRIMDPACGTGTLLMAALKTVKDRAFDARPPDEGEAERLHQALIEGAIHGLDINHYGVQMAACGMTLGAPSVDYAKMNLKALKHGPGEGRAFAGSLELLADSDEDDPLKNLARGFHAPTAVASSQLAGEALDEDAEGFAMRDFDLVIMNPPYSANQNRGRKFTKDGVTDMQAREGVIKSQVEARDSTAGRLITINSISTFFTPLANALVASDGALAKILPTTACIGADGRAERRFLADRFHVEIVVTSHDPKAVSLSESTSIHESMMVCRRWPEGRPKPATRFVSLARLPVSHKEAVACADAIAEGDPGAWGRQSEWPRDRIAAGDWTPAQWFDGRLAQIALELEGHPALEPFEKSWKLGPTGRAAQDSWERWDPEKKDEEDEVDEEDVLQATLIFDSVSSKLRRSMAGEPEQWVVPGGRRKKLWEGVRDGSGHVLLVLRMDTHAGVLSALRGNDPTFGFGWTPVLNSGGEAGKALCAWWNSTPGRLLLLNRRSKKLTYSKMSHEMLRSIPAPSKEHPRSSALARAFDRAKGMDMLPMAMGDECNARRIIDDAAAEVLGVSPDDMAEWRRLLSLEPTISGRSGD